MNKLKFLEKITALLAVFFLPSQLALHFWPAFSFVYGLRVDYLSPAIYLSDSLILFVLILCLINNRKLLLSFFLKNKNIFLILFFISFINILFSTYSLISFLKWLKIFEVTFFGIYIFLRKYFLGQKNILKSLYFSTLLISVIGLAQFFLKRTTGFFYFLGERSFNLITPGIALVSLKGEIFLRAYSTFSHPNSFAGYLLVVVLLFVFSKDFKRTKIWYLSLSLFVLSLLTTFSTSVFISLALMIPIYILIKTKAFKLNFLKILLFLSSTFSLLLSFYSQTLINSIVLPRDIYERIELSFISGKIIADKFWFGSGLNTFIANSIHYKGIENYVWILQPVHNIFLLVFTEAGILGLLFFLYIVYKLIQLIIRQKNYLAVALIVGVLITGLSDHYWLTLQQNLLILALALGYSLQTKSKES